MTPSGAKAAGAIKSAGAWHSNSMASAESQTAARKGELENFLGQSRTLDAETLKHGPLQFHGVRARVVRPIDYTSEMVELYSDTMYLSNLLVSLNKALGVSQSNIIIFYRLSIKVYRAIVDRSRVPHEESWDDFLDRDEG